MCKTWYKNENAPTKKGPRKEILATSINKPFAAKHRRNIGPLCPSTW